MHHVYFTDGGCMNPTMSEARLASWSVVRDFANDWNQAMASTSISLEMSEPCPLLRAFDMGITEGRQTISHGELCAAIMACEAALVDRNMVRSDIITDSQYVVNVVHFLERGNVSLWGYKVANFDLVSRLKRSWDTGKFRIHKVKSHLDWSCQKDLFTTRLVMDNYGADRVVSLALNRCPSWMRKLANTMAEHRMTQKQGLSRVFAYLVELNHEQKNRDDVKAGIPRQRNELQPDRNLMCDEAINLLRRYTFSGGHSIHHDLLDSDALQASLQGVNLARYILKRAETIVWPENPHDWGQDSCGGKAIHRFGFTSQIASLATRLKLQRQVETVDAVYNYIKMSATKDKLRLNVVSITTFNDITLPLVPGPSAEQRFKSYKIIYKRRSME